MDNSGGAVGADTFNFSFEYSPASNGPIAQLLSDLTEARRVIAWSLLVIDPHVNVGLARAMQDVLNRPSLAALAHNL